MQSGDKPILLLFCKFNHNTLSRWFGFYFKRGLIVALFFSLWGCADYRNILVKKVIDGDTVILANGSRLRYIGIDAPETWVREGEEFVYRPEPLGPEATEFNRALVEGKFVKVEFDVEPRDRYGRLLGYCFVDGILVNEKLIKKGYATLYTFFPNTKYFQLLLEAQDYARKQKKGLWQGSRVISWQEAKENIGKAQTVKGKVMNTYQSENVVVLNFNSKYRRGFQVVIFKTSLEFFRKKNINPVDFYRGKTVKVAGLIRKYRGPQIIVSSPAEIQVIEQ